MSRNPILNDRAFGNTETGRSPSEEWAAAQADGWADSAGATTTTTWQRGAQTHDPADLSKSPRTAGPIIGAESGGRVMSLGGVSAAALVMFVFIILGAFFGWSRVSIQTLGRAADGSVITSATVHSPGLLIGALLGGFVLAIATAFMPKIARFTAIPYSLIEGTVLGFISHLYESESSGIVLQAILATFAVFAVMLALYGLRILRATPRFVKGVIAATFGVVAMYMIGWVISLFSQSFVPFWASSGVMGIGISIVIVVIAAMNLILDFDFIERGSKNDLPAYMDWYAAFGLMVTLIWLYLELLRLLSKLRSQ